MVGVFLDECKTQITLLLFVYNTANFQESGLVMAGFFFWKLQEGALSI